MKSKAGILTGLILFLSLILQSVEYAPAIAQVVEIAPSQTILKSYILKNGNYYPTTAYRPRQFKAGVRVDLNTAQAVTDPGPYAGFDLLQLPNGSVYTFSHDPDSATIELNRPAQVVVIWRASPSTPIPTWLSGWTPGPTVKINNVAKATFTKLMDAGLTNLGGIYDPKNPSKVSTSNYTVLLGEATGLPSNAPPVPEGLETPHPNQLCPIWVHDRYVTVAPDGKTYPTWHPQIDPVYWCYFGHEHGSDPSYFDASYKPAYGYTDGSIEAHPGFKTYIFDDGSGYLWMITHHFGTATNQATCGRFHGVETLIKDKATGEIVANVRQMTDFGISVVNTTGQPYIPSGCSDQGTLLKGNTGVRRLPSREAGGTDYEPWRVSKTALVNGLKLSELTFNTLDPIAMCNDIVCNNPVRDKSNSGSLRVLTVYPGTSLKATSAASGTFYTDRYAQQIVPEGTTGALQQYVKPGLDVHAVGCRGVDLFGFGKPYLCVNVPTQPTQRENSIGAGPN